jgi:hypothetical protein
VEESVPTAFLVPGQNKAEGSELRNGERRAESAREREREKERKRERERERKREREKETFTMSSSFSELTS